MGLLSLFSKKIPKDRKALFEAAARDLPWIQSGETAIIPPKTYEAATGYHRQLIQALEDAGESLKPTQTGPLQISFAAAHPELEAAVNHAHGLKANGARAAQKSAIALADSVLSQKGTALDLVALGDAKHGITI